MKAVTQPMPLGLRHRPQLAARERVVAERPGAADREATDQALYVETGALGRPEQAGREAHPEHLAAKPPGRRVQRDPWNEKRARPQQPDVGVVAGHRTREL